MVVDTLDWWSMIFWWIVRWSCGRLEKFGVRVSFAVLYGVIRCDKKSGEKIHVSQGENLEFVLKMMAEVPKFLRFE